MDDSPQIRWPPFAETYLDEFGRIDGDVYEAAREVWPRAAALAKTTLNDEGAGQIALLTVCARITKARSEDRIHIKSLNAYVFRSYQHEILGQLQRRRLHEALTLANYASIEGTQTDIDVERKILLEQIIARMDERNLRVFRLRVLGHSLEEIARMLDRPSNVIRNEFSRQLKKIRQELDG